MKRILLFITLCFILFSCYRNPITGRIELNLESETQMMSMSSSEYSTFLSQHPPLPDQDDRVTLVRNCGTRIQKAVENYYASKGLSNQLAGYDWTFNVVDEETVNAWCMPGGKVVVYSGLLPVTLDEQSLAIVMGHEISHAVARHGNQRMSDGMVAQFGASVLSVALSQRPQVTQQFFLQSFGAVSELGILKYSRKDETEADKMGLIFAAMAGYDPEVSIPFWQRMEASSSANAQQQSTLLSTHPSDEKRIKDLKAFMPKAKKYYKPQKE